MEFFRDLNWELNTYIFFWAISLNTASLNEVRINITSEDVYWLEDRKERLRAERPSNGIRL